VAYRGVLGARARQPGDRGLCPRDDSGSAPRDPSLELGLSLSDRLHVVATDPVEGKSAAIPLQADFVNNIVLPHFYVFAPVVYSLEVLTAVSLMLGIFVGFWGVIGALQILNLWLGLYNAAGEWPWTYFFLLVLMVIFAVHHYGRSLGLDAVIVARSRARHTLASTLLAEVT
jgi:uncharacterized membrane protein YphA (DoxX/SURF4 family)